MFNFKHITGGLFRTWDSLSQDWKMMMQPQQKQAITKID